MRHLPLLLLLTVGCSDSELAGENSAEGIHLAGIGDSIMQGFDATPCNAPICFDQPEYSFAQGTTPEVNSLLSRLGSPPSTFVSVSGAEMVGGRNNALAQARRLCDTAVSPTHVVVLLGANDLCGASTLEDLPGADELSSALEEALLLLTSSSCDLSRDAAIHVLSIPRLDLLTSAGRAKTDANCVEIWSEYDICPIATQAESADVTEAIANRIAEVNSALEATTHKVADGLARDRTLTLSYDSSVGSYRFAPDDLSSVDCFHPSVEGQAKLACLAWEGWLGEGNSLSCLE